MTAKRHGEAQVPSEREFDEGEITDYGANSVGEFLEEISPLVGGNGRRPEILVNGQRVADPRTIASYPPEALQRAEILPERAAGQYGFSPDARVVNLVLKQTFSSMTGTAFLSAPTQGGRTAGQLSARYFSVAGQARWSGALTLDRAGSLSEADREVSAPPGLASTGGNFSAADGGEIDPALSALAGFPVTTIAIPAGAVGFLPIEAFMAGAGNPYPRDDNAFRTILPHSENLGVELGIARPLALGSLSLDLKAGRQTSHRLLGLPDASLLLPASSPFSPFANDVVLERLLEGEPLAGRQRSIDVNLTAGYSQQLGRHSLTASVGYARQEGSSDIDQGFDLTDVQAGILAGDPHVDPFGRPSLGAPRTERSRSLSETVSTSLFGGGPVLALPAGPLFSAITVSHRRTAFRSSREADGVADKLVSILRQSDAGLNLVAPLTSRQGAVLPWLGDVQLSFNGGLAAVSGQGWRARYGGGLTWSPIEGVMLGGRLSVEDIVPGTNQLTAPVVETPAVRIYDYTRGELAEAVAITGGNPALLRGSGRHVALTAMISPWSWEGPTLNVDFQRREMRGAIGSLPALTPAVEAAFPDRVFRDPAGRLIRIDQRPINLAQDMSETLATRFNWNVPLGPPPEPAPEPAPDAAAAPADGSRPRGGRRGPRIQLSLSHNWQLRNSLTIRDGLAPLDRLDGEGGGQSRHSLQAEARFFARGSGIRVAYEWNSAYVTRAGTGGAGDLHFGALGKVKAEINLDLGRFAPLGKPAWLDKTRLSLDVDNLLDGRQRVTRSDGSVPSGYLPDDVDPIGRAIKLSVSRQF